MHARSVKPACDREISAPPNKPMQPTASGAGMSAILRLWRWRRAAADGQAVGRHCPFNYNRYYHDLNINGIRERETASVRTNVLWPVYGTLKR